MFENPRRNRQARNFTTNVPKILVLKSSSEQIFSRKLPLGAPEIFTAHYACRNAALNLLTPVTGTTNEFIFANNQFINRILGGTLDLP